MIAIPFILSSLIDWLFFFGNLIPRCLISLNFHIILGVYFFYHSLKTWPGSRPPLCLGSWVGLNDQGYWGQSYFFYCAGSKNDIILMEKIMVEKSTGVDMIFP